MQPWDVMCHCEIPVSEMSDRERKRALEEHSREELRAELSPEEFNALVQAA